MDAKQIDAVLAEPRYDGWGPDEPWGHWDWVTWHHSLVDRFGPDLADQLWGRAWLSGLSRVGGGTGSARGAGHVFDAVPTIGRADDNWADWVRSSPVREAAVYRGPAAYMETLSALAAKANDVANVVVRTPTALLMLALGAIVIVALRKK